MSANAVLVCFGMPGRAALRGEYKPLKSGDRVGFFLLREEARTETTARGALSRKREKDSPKGKGAEGGNPKGVVV
jgi:hypothetical protein